MGSGVAYEPLAGWVQVTKQQDTGLLNSQRFHKDHACATTSVSAAVARGEKHGRPVTSYLSDRMSFAQASRLTHLAVCKCAGGRRGHYIARSDRRYGEVQGGSPGSGRRR